MSWYAIDAITDAFDAARELLFPFDRGRWLRLGILVFFVTGATGTGNGGQGIVSYSVDAGDLPQEWAFQTPERAGAIVLTIVAVLVLLGLAFFLVSSVMQFVFFDALRTGEVRIREPFRRRFRQGAGLFAFSLVVGGGFAALVAGSVALGIVVLGGIGALVLILLLPLLLILGLALGIFFGFTTEFVVPVAIAEDVGILAGWRRFWPTLRGDPWQFAVYVLVRFVLGILVSAAVGLVVGFLVLPVALLFGLLVAGVFVAANGTLSPVVTGALVLLAIPFGLFFLALGVAVQIPVSTYFGYFALLVLGDAEERFDLIPELRTEVRAEA